MTIAHRSLFEFFQYETRTFVLIFHKMSGNPNLQPVKKRKKNAADRQQPEWLFPAPEQNPAFKPHHELSEKEKLEKEKSIDFLKRRAAGAPTKPAPPVQLLNLIAVFLAEYNFLSTGRMFANERRARSKIDGWKDETGGKLENGMPTLAKIYKEWHKEWEERRVLDMTSSDEDDDAATKREKMLKKRDAKKTESQKSKSKDDSTSSSGTSSSEDSDVEMADAPPVKKTGAKKKSSSSSSSSTTSSESDADDEKEVPSVGSSLPKVKATSSALKRKAASSSSSSGSDSSSSSNEVPKSKKVKTITAPETDSDSSSSESDHKEASKSTKATSSNDATSSSSSSGSDSDSDSDSDSGESVAKKTPLPESSSDSSDSSDSSSESADEAPATKKKQVSNSDSSATLTNAKKGSSATSSDSDTSSSESEDATAKQNLSPPLPPTPVAKLPRKKVNEPFSRIPKDIKVDKRLASNAYVPYDYAQKAHEDLIITRGKGFTKEKNKKKRGSYKGGYIDVEGKKGIKFDD